MENQESWPIKKLEEDVRIIIEQKIQYFSPEAKAKIALNFRMFFEQFQRLILRWEKLHALEKEITNWEGKDTGAIQKEFVNETEGIAQQAYALISSLEKFIKSLKSEEWERGLKDSASGFLEFAEEKLPSLKPECEILNVVLTFRVIYVDHPHMARPFTWATSGDIYGRMYVHYEEYNKSEIFTPPHHDLIVSSLGKLVQDIFKV